MPGPPKGATALRRVPSSLSKVSTPPATPPTQPSKTSKKSLIIKLKISPQRLSTPGEKVPTAKATDSKAKPTPKSSTKSSTSAGAALAKVKSEEAISSRELGETDDAHSPSKSASEGDKNGPKTGEKREADATVEEDAKGKPKGVQRKRPKVGENGRLDGRTAAAKAAGFIASAHKLGPKANQGAINEKLRALDRTGKSCRRWQKTGFKVKSFTGRTWELPTWRAPEVRSFGSEAESKSDSNDVSKENSSSNIGSESKTPAGAGLDILVSSPAVTSAA